MRSSASHRSAELRLPLPVRLRRSISLAEAALLLHLLEDVRAVGDVAEDHDRIRLLAAGARDLRGEVARVLLVVRDGVALDRARAELAREGRDEAAAVRVVHVDD